MYNAVINSNTKFFFCFWLSASRRASRKRAISASPYSEMDLSTLIRYSPTALHLLNGGSPTSSGSYGHLSPGKIFYSFLNIKLANLAAYGSDRLKRCFTVMPKPNRTIKLLFPEPKPTRTEHVKTA